MNQKEYIPYLRSKVGHERIMAIGVSCLIINEKEEVLLEKRKDNGLFCLPGGGLDFDETVKEGIKREVREETGMELHDVSLFMILSGKKEQFLYPNGDLTDYVDLIFYTRIKSSQFDRKAKHDDESSQIDFYPLDQLPKEEEFLRGTLPILRKYRQGDFTVTVD